MSYLSAARNLIEGLYGMVMSSPNLTLLNLQTFFANPLHVECSIRNVAYLIWLSRGLSHYPSIS